MKTLIRCIETLLFAGLVAFLMMAGLNVANAQPRDRGGRNVHSNVLKKLPNGHSKVRANGNRYFFSKGKYYGKSRRGYSIVNAPIGAVVKRLPKGRNVVWIGDQKFFRHKGVFYVKVRRGFEVVAFPWHFAASWSGVGFGGMFFTPGFMYKYSRAHGTYRFAKKKKTWRKMKAQKRTMRRNGNRGVGKTEMNRRGAVDIKPNRRVRGQTNRRRSN